MSKNSPLNPKARKPGKRSKDINLKRSEGQERRVRNMLWDAIDDGLQEVEINGKPVSLNSKKEIDAIVKQVLKDLDK